MEKKWSIIIILYLLIVNLSFAQTYTLDYYLRNALDNSPLLRDYQNQVASNQIDSLLIKATYKPQVTGTSNNSYAPLIKGFGYDQAITNGGGVNALVGVNQALVSRRN